MAAQALTLSKTILDQYASPSSVDSGNFLLSFSAADFKSPAAQESSSASGETSQACTFTSLDKAQRKKLAFRQSVSVPGSGISGLGSIAEVASAMPRLRSVDVQGNSLALYDLFALISALPQLETLDFGRNDLSGAFPESMDLACSNLHTLSLNACEISQASVGAVVRALPKLQHLHVCSNNWTSIQTLVDHVGDKVCVSKLFLGGNPLHSLDATLACLASWAHLSHLDVSRTHFDLQPGDTALSPSARPAHLQFLGLDECNLDTWAAVQAVGSLAVPAVRMRRVPACSSAEEHSNTAHSGSGVAATGSSSEDEQCGRRGLDLRRASACGQQTTEAMLRQLTIALLPDTDTLNGSRITGADRVAAERFAVRYFRNWAQDEMATAGIAAGEGHNEQQMAGGSMWQPASLPRLVEKHGNLGPLAVVSLGGPSSVTLEVTYEWDPVQVQMGLPKPPEGLPRPNLVDIALKQTVGELKQQLSTPLAHLPHARVACVVYVDVEALSYVGEQDLNMNSLQVSTLRPSEQDRLRVIVKQV